MKALVSALQRLYEMEAHQAAGSMFTKAQRSALDTFIQQTQSVRCITSGRGLIYQIIQIDVIELTLKRLSPGYFDKTSSSLPNRAVNIANARSSKAGQHSHSTYYLLMRSSGEGVQWVTHDQQLNVSGQTEQYGVAALEVMPNDLWTSKHPLWLVENQAIFDSLDWLPDGINASVHWYRGQLSNAFLDWLSERDRASEVVLFPDYDGVGLNNYARLHQRLGDRCSLWFMPNWEEKLHKYGSNEIWADTFKDFRTAADYFSQLPRQDESLKTLLNALKSQGLALEQEAVWL